MCRLVNLLLLSCKNSLLHFLHTERMDVIERFSKPLWVLTCLDCVCAACMGLKGPQATFSGFVLPTGWTFFLNMLCLFSVFRSSPFALCHAVCYGSLVMLLALLCLAKDGQSTPWSRWHKSEPTKSILRDSLPVRSTILRTNHVIMTSFALE